ncbi:MAG TPA: phosphoethanolamine transferase [Anaeromyxobacteraceae bacterium]|nr:phosphoethanolamine transferase [Anaeromyxobacteraceae bacterium]
MEETLGRRPRFVADSVAGWRVPGVLWLLPLCAFLLSPPLASLAWTLGRGGGHVVRDAVLAWNVAMSLLWLGALHLVVSRPAWLHLALLPLYLTTAVDLFLALRYQARLTSSYVSIALTDYADAGSFVALHRVEILAILLPLAALLLLALRGLRRVRLPAPPAVRVAAVALVAAGYLGATLHQERTGNMTFGRALLDVLSHDTSSPAGVVSQVSVTLALFAQTDRHTVERQAFSFGARQAAPAADEVVVLVIGESSRPDRWGLGGARRDTTPRLAREPNLAFLPDAVATGSLTSVSVPSMLSLAPVSDWAAVESQRSIVSAFRECGYETAWYSTQEVSHWSGMIHHVAAEAAERRYLDRARDTALVDALRRLLAERPGPRRAFVVLHTRGSHAEYDKRYPPEFRRFATPGATRAEAVRDAFDNSVLYTDWVLAELIGALRARGGPALLVYASDHGENLLDDGAGLLGHGFDNRWDLAAAAFVWWSDAWGAAHRRQVAALRANAGAPVSLAAVPHSLLDAAGIEARGLDRTQSLFSDAFRPRPRVYLSGGAPKVWPGGRLTAAPERQPR